LAGASGKRFFDNEPQKALHPPGVSEAVTLKDI
jgi:hypothetical protein